VEFRIPFNKPFIVGKELYYIAQAVTLGNLGGDGPFTQKCRELLEQRFEIPHVLLTPSCTAALEMAVSLCAIGDGDEVIMPSFTFVSTANAVARTGATPVFVDIRPDTLNLDERLVEAAIGPKTRAMIPVHYAGVGCEMDRLLRIAEANEVLVIEDAAQAVNAFYKSRALGSTAQLGTYSFHETKNYICGEGGALCVNDPRFLDDAHILRDKGTNRQEFLRGEVAKYEWVEVSSSYVPSELVSAFLWGQLEAMEHISDRRRHVFEYYFEKLGKLEERGLLKRPFIPDHCRTNYHLFFVILPTHSIRNGLQRFLSRHGIQAISHFEPLHISPMGKRLGLDEQSLPVTESVAPRLLRLPLFYDITEEEQAFVVDTISDFLGDGENQKDTDWPLSLECAHGRVS
jgi:dTDP-4-amino-4,6-dideoxygalactose transaminase